MQENKGRLLGVIAILAIVVVGSLVFSRLQSAPTTERAVPGPAPTATVDPAAPNSTPTGEPTQTAATQTPATQPGQSTIPCVPDPGNPDLGTTMFIDMDGDGRDEAIAPVETRGSVLEYALFEPTGECFWIELLRLPHGDEVADEDGATLSHRWTCTHGQRFESGAYATNLVQATTRSDGTTDAGATATVRQYEFGVWLNERSTTILDATALTLDEPAVACDPAGLVGETATRVETCRRDDWQLDVPPGWLTPAFGSESCGWFTQQTQTLPCQCDAVAVLSVGQSTQRPTGELVGELIVDDYPAKIVEELGLEGTGGLLINRRSTAVNLGVEGVGISVNSQDWLGEWDELTAILDEVTATIEIVGAPLPTTQMFYPDIPRIGAGPSYLDPAAHFAWYLPRDTTDEPPCDGDDRVQIVRLDVGASLPDEMQFDLVGDFPSGAAKWIEVLNEDTARLVTSCLSTSDVSTESRQSQQSQTNRYEFTFSSDGQITSVTEEPVESFEPPVQLPDTFGETPDGQYRYATGIDPLGRLTYSCSGSRTSPSSARTLLRYEGTNIAPAFRDLSLTRGMNNMHITDSGIAIWQALSCQSTHLEMGRVDSEGFIVDRHPVGLNLSNSPAWAVAGDELIALVPVFIHAEDGNGNGAGGRPSEIPNIIRFDLNDSPGWVVTADPPPRIDREAIATSFDGEAQWFLGQNLAASGECGAGQTIYQSTPDGHRRIIQHGNDIDGDVVDIVTAPLTDTSRVVVALTACPEQHDGLSIWIATQFSDSRYTFFHPLAVEPIQAMSSLTATMDLQPGPTIIATVTLLDGTTADIDLS